MQRSSRGLRNLAQTCMLVSSRACGFTLESSLQILKGPRYPRTANLKQACHHTVAQRSKRSKQPAWKRSQRVLSPQLSITAGLSKLRCPWGVFAPRVALVRVSGLLREGFTKDTIVQLVTFSIGPKGNSDFGVHVQLENLRTLAKLTCCSVRDSSFSVSHCKGACASQLEAGVWRRTRLAAGCQRCRQ